MIIEVNDAGEVVIPAELVQAPPHTKIEADREGEAVVLKPVAGEPETGKRLSVKSWTMLKGRLTDPTMTFRREDTYGDDGMPSLSTSTFWSMRIFRRFKQRQQQPRAFSVILRDSQHGVPRLLTHNVEDFARFVPELSLMPLVEVE